MTQGVPPAEPPVYHMCIETELDAATGNGGMYYSPTFPQDKFIHATAEPQYLIDVANHFYKETVGEWVCIKLDVSRLGGKVVYESPAPVGNIAAYDHAKEQEKEQPKFPHIYGGIPARAIMARYRIRRATDGTFLSIDGIC